MVNGAIEAKVCSISQGQPAMGSRSAAMISIRRRISLEGCMGTANSLPIDAATESGRSARAALAQLADAERLKRERNSLASFGRVNDSHGDLLTFGKMRNASGTQDRDVDEHIFPAVLARDKAEPLGVVEPLDLSGDRNGGRRIRRNPARPKPVAR